MRAWENRSVRERNRIGRRRGQEEIAGFVAIVLIVSVIIVIFIGASLNNKSYDRKNLLLLHYLQSLSQTTTDCTSYGSNYRDIAELTRDCHNNRRCSSGDSACAVLNNTLEEIITGTLAYGANYSRSGYIISVFYRNGFQEEKIIVKTFGSCSGDYSKAEFAFAELPGTITISLQECY